MPDREKVINDLQDAVNDDWMWQHADYYAKAMENALVLLKEQEAVKPYLDFDGADVWRCGNCHSTIYHLEHTQADEDAKNYALFCRHCGKPVDWTTEE